MNISNTLSTAKIDELVCVATPLGYIIESAQSHLPKQISECNKCHHKIWSFFSTGQRDVALKHNDVCPLPSCSTYHSLQGGCGNPKSIHNSDYLKIFRTFCRKRKRAASKATKTRSWKGKKKFHYSTEIGAKTTAINTYWEETNSKDRKKQYESRKNSRFERICC